MSYLDKIKERAAKLESPTGGEPPKEPLSNAPLPAPSEGRPAAPSTPQSTPQAATAQQEQPMGFDVDMLQAPNPAGPPDLTDAAAAEDNGVMAFIEAAYDSLNFINPARGAYDAINTEESPTRGAAFTGAMMDHASMGTFDAIAAADQAFKAWLVEGADFSTAYADKKDEINARLAENRAGYPGATMGGAMTGGTLAMALPGMGMDKLWRGANWVGRALIGAGAGGTEAAVYRYNSDGTKEEILRDGSLGTLGGLLFAGFGSALGNRVRRVSGKDHSATERAAAKQLLDAINLKVTASGQPPMSPEDLTRLMNERGMEAVMADFYPDMIPMLQKTLAVPGSEGYKNALAIINTRSNVEQSFSQAIDDIVSIPRSRSRSEFTAFTNARHARLQPQYNNILDGAEQAGVKFKPAGLMEAVADSYSDMPVGDAGQMREAMASFRKILNSKSTGKKDGKRLTMRALHNAKQEFYRANKGNPAAQRVYDMTTQWLSEIDPDYAKLSRTYASAIHDEKAFNTGYKYFTGKQQTSDDVQAVMSRLGTYSELTAFAQGARRKLMEDLKGKSPQAVSKYLFEQSYKVDMLKAALGEERAHKLLGAVMAEVAGETTLRSLNAGKAAAANSDQAPQITKQLADAAIAMLSPGRSPGRVRAVTNTLLPRDAQSPTTAANIIGEYATAPLESHSQLFRQLNDLAKFGKPTGKNRTATMTGGFAGATQAEAQNEIQRYLEQNQ